MRCLYCGKELALLKRWAGGGEFCSDAHRQRYQEEFNQLALNRLLQAKPPSESQKPATDENQTAGALQPTGDNSPEMRSLDDSAYGLDPTAVAPRAEHPVDEAAFAHRIEPSVAPAYEPQSHSEPNYPEPHYAAPEPKPVDVPAPADPAGFFVEMPVPALAEVPAMAHPDLALLSHATASLPHHDFQPVDGQQLAAAGHVAFEPSNRVLDYTNGKRELRLEVREFVRTAPIIEFALAPVGNAEFDTSEQAIDVLISPRPPQGDVLLWQEPLQTFKAIETELGGQTRLDFPTTGFEKDGESVEIPKAPPPATSNVAPTPKSEFDRLLADLNDPAPPPIPTKVQSEKVPSEPEKAFKPVPELAEPIAIKARPVAFSAPPRFAARGNVSSVSKEETSAQMSANNAAPATTQEKQPPLAVTKPLPMVLHGLAPGKAKPLQVFPPSAVLSTTEAQVPRSNALPLRPVIVFGPAPAAPAPAPLKKADERTVVAKNDPKKPPITVMPGRSDANPANSKSRVPDVRVTKPEAKATEAKSDPKAPETKTPEVRQEAKQETKQPDVKQDTKPSEQKASPTTSKKETPQKEPPKFVVKPGAKEEAKAAAKEDPKATAKAPTKENTKPATKQDSKPMSNETNSSSTAVAPPSNSDLGLPSLKLETSQGFWGKLPVAAKIGIAVLVLAAISAAIYFGTKGGEDHTASAAGAVVEAGPALAIGESGWITDWGADPGVRRTHQISILGSSQTLTDYRVEFQAQIESKAVGWVFRAADPKNFYVTKLEVVKPGLDPSIALVRFAVINGEEQPRAQLPLSLQVHRDTMYKIRFEVVGDKFTTWVLDQKVDSWSDDRVKTGGVGLYSERGEVAPLKGNFSVVPLVIRK